VHPHFVLETRHASAALAAPYAIGDSRAAERVPGAAPIGLARGDLALIAEGLRDGLVETARGATPASLASRLRRSHTVR
jgi:homoserine kinase